MRTSFSPIKASVLPKVYEKIGLDERDHIIRKLKEDLIVARGKVKQISILEHYLANLLDKTKSLQNEKMRQNEQHKLRAETTNRAINEEKKDLQMMRGQFKKLNKELSQEQADFHQLKRVLDGKSIEVQRQKDDSLYLYNQHQKLLQENYRLKTQFDNGIGDNRRVIATKHDLQERITEFNRKIGEVRTYLATLKDEQQILRQKLGSYEIQNNEIGVTIDRKQDNIDHLEHQFARKHDDIKHQVETYIEFEHENQRFLQQTRHKINLVKVEIEKSSQLNHILGNLQKNLFEQQKGIEELKIQNRQIDMGIEQYASNNQRLKRDLVKCQEHLQNLLGWNAHLHAKLDEYVKNDDEIILLIRNKRRNVPSTIDSYRSIGRY